VGVSWKLKGHRVEVNQVIAVSLINRFHGGICININKVVWMERETVFQKYFLYFETYPPTHRLVRRVFVMCYFTVLYL